MNQILDHDNVVIKEIITEKNINTNVDKKIVSLRSKEGYLYFTTDELEPMSIVSKKIKYFDFYLQDKTLVDKLNIFIEGVTKRLGYMMKIPTYEKNTQFLLGIDSINKKPVVEYQDKSTRVNVSVVNELLTKCRYKLLLKLNSLIIDNTVRLSIKLVKISILTLDNASLYLTLMKEFNGSLSNSVETFNSLMTVNINTTTKQQTKNKIKDILNKNKNKKY